MDCSPLGSSAHGILQARILSGLPCPPPGDLPDPGTEPFSLHLQHWQAGSLPAVAPTGVRSTDIFTVESLLKPFNLLPYVLSVQW